MIRRYSDIPVEDVDRIVEDLKVLIKNHGVEEVRIVSSKHFERLRTEEKLRAEIQFREEELQKLKKELP